MLSRRSFLQTTSAGALAARPIPRRGAEGVLVCCGGISGGFSLFIKDGTLHWEHNYDNEVHYRASSAETNPPILRVMWISA